MPSDGPREHRSLDLSPQSPQVIGGLPVIDTLDILLDFGAILARR